MRYIKIDDLKSGMILAQPILNKSGKIFLAQNVAVSQYMISRLKDECYNGAYIYDDLSANIIVKNQIPAHLQLQSIRNLKSINVDECVYISGQIVKSLEHIDSICMNTMSLASYDTSTYMHSMNVAVYAGTFGMLYGFDVDQVKNLIMAGLLHDIGKTRISEKIINKPGKLTNEEYEEVRKHPEYGYEMLKDYESIPSVVRVSVLQHHENCDGSGYTRGLKDKETYIFAKIIHICDVYDAMLSRRSYKEPISPNKVIEFLTSHKGKMFNPELVDFFLKSITPYPNGVLVKLSDGRTAIVAEQNKDIPDKPVVRDMNGNTLNLAEENYISILHIEI